ncbi:MAG: NACHT domain-containing protein [Thiotrichaceae bacterium]|nr:NACHT domain-containing protein [Thiotrichaceae bacterium]
MDDNLQERAGHPTIIVKGDVKNASLNIGNHNKQDTNSSESTTSSASTNIEDKNLRILLDKVEEYWVDGILKHALHKELWIELGKQLEQDKLHQPLRATYEVPNQKPQPLSYDTKISQIFFEHQRLLVILGDPGAGKTTTLLDLAKDLIQQAKQDHSQPIPVVFNLSSWSSGKYQDLHQWLIDELKQKYTVNKDLSVSWLKHQQILPLLDGLDEVKAEFRDNCVAAINDFISGYQVTGAVVCCRAAEYQALSTYLQFRCAVNLQALTQEQIGDYLQQAGDSLAALRVLLDTDAESCKLAGSPLMLGVMSLTYADVSADAIPALLGDTGTQRQTQLFEQYIEKAIDRKGNEQPYTKQYIKDKLSWLGFQMQQHGQSVFMLENMQVSWLAGSSQRLIYGLIIGLIVGLIVGLVVGLVVGLITGLINAGLEKQLSETKVQPNQGIRFTLKNALFVGFTGSILFGIIGYAMWFFNLNDWSLVNNLLLILSIGFISGFLTYGGESIIQHYSLRLTLHWFKTFPFKAVPLLEHCTKLILLRRVGGGYIFIHRLLLEHFAQKYRDKQP